MKTSAQYIVMTALLFAAIGVRAATVTYIIGDVWIKKGRSWQSARVRDPLPSGAVIRTGERSLAIVTLADGSALKIYPDTSFTVTGDNGSKKEATLVDLDRGMVFIKLLKQAPGRIFFVNYKTVVASVRGTLFYVAVTKKSLFNRDYWLCVNEGAVHVEEKSSGASVTVPQGKGILVKGARTITPPRAYDWTGRLNWNMDPARGPVAGREELEKQDSMIPDRY